MPSITFERGSKFPQFRENVLGPTGGGPTVTHATRERQNAPLQRALPPPRAPAPTLREALEATAPHRPPPQVQARRAPCPPAPPPTTACPCPRAHQPRTCRVRAHQPGTCPQSARINPRASTWDVPPVRDCRQSTWVTCRSEPRLLWLLPMTRARDRCWSRPTAPANLYDPFTAAPQLGRPYRHRPQRA
jgi:hypothetical protein